MKRKSTARPPRKRTAVVRPRDREHSAARILEAAIAVFSEVGYDGATTRMIAARAGLNESLINRYFQGKGGLLAAISEKFFERRDGLVLEHRAGATVEEELIHYATSRFEFEIRHRDLVRICVSRCAVDTALCENVRKRFPLKDDLLLEQRLTEFCRAGKMREQVDVKEVCRAISAQVFSMIFLQYMVLGADKEEVLKSLKDFCRTYARGMAR